MVACINMWQDIIVPFLTIGLAEIGDKSQLSILLLSTRIKNHLHLLFGVILAFFIVDGAAILFGSWINNILPHNLLKYIAGAMFLVFGYLTWKSMSDTKSRTVSHRSAFFSGFMIVFISEWGDKTQLVSAAFSSKFDPLLVLLGVLLSVTLLSICTVYFGHFLLQKINKKTLTKIASVLFLILGVSFILS